MRKLILFPIYFYAAIRHTRLIKLLGPVDLLIGKIFERFPIKTNFNFKLFMRHPLNLYLLLNGYHERDITVIVLNILKEGDLCIDVGAHCGYYTLLFSKIVKEKGVVISFEPDKNNLSLLIRNVKLNKCNNVKIYPYAVSDNDSFAILSVDEKTGFDSYIMEATKSNIDSKISMVKTIKLDSLNYEKPVNLLKLDVQGNEVRVLKGSHKVLINTKYVIFEYCPNMIVKRTKENPLLVFEILSKNNFNLYLIKNERFIKLNKLDKNEFEKLTYELLMNGSYAHILAIKNY
jgi:FkbM family methyltransferase